MRAVVRLLAVTSLFVVGTALSCNRTFAINASPHPVKVKQPDGLDISLRLRGAESHHWYEDLQGFSVVRGANRAYVYAQAGPGRSVQASDRVVGRDAPPPGTPRGLIPPRQRIAGQLPGLPTRISAAPRAASSGAVKNLVILMRFSNHAARPLPKRADFDVIFNKPGGDPTLAPTGSVRDVYLENSYGQMQLDSTVADWVTLPKSEQYYANGQSGMSPRIAEAITDALELADQSVDFSQFDKDHDGWVDAIAFVHSGYGAEWGGADQDGVDFTDRIWSHRWSIGTWTSNEGVKVSDYHINPGLWSTSGSQPGRIGVICHESGHFFGLPDLYDTSQAGEGVGSWELMANSWGFDGSQLHPPHFGAYSKIFLGWLTPKRITAEGTYTVDQVEKLTPSGAKPVVYLIDDGYSGGEYLLVENRQPVGYDAGIPSGGAGLAIWHIDELKSANNQPGFPGQAGWPQNNRHYMVSLLQADGGYDLELGLDRGDDGDMYRQGGNADCSPTSVPNNLGYQSGVVVTPRFSLSQISASGALMTFKVTEVAPAPAAGSGKQVAQQGSSQSPANEDRGAGASRGVQAAGIALAATIGSASSAIEESAAPQSEVAKAIAAATSFAAALADEDSPEYFALVDAALLTAQRASMPSGLDAAAMPALDERSILTGALPRSIRMRAGSRDLSAPMVPAGSIFNSATWRANQDKLLQLRSKHPLGVLPRIIGGVPAVAGQFPHCVAVGSNGQYCCTGTLIGPRLVLTAGHCVAGSCNARIYTGLNANFPQTGLTYKVKTAVLHPGYNLQTLENDIGLLVLENDVAGVEPCDIATASQIENAFFVRLAGYGFTEFGGFGEQYTVDCPIACAGCDNGCDGVSFGCHPGMELVAGGNGVDSCNGDSGGPAYILDGDQVFLAGSTSRATADSVQNCGDGGIYVRSDKYLPWIQATASAHGVALGSGPAPAPAPEAAAPEVAAPEVAAQR